MSSFPKLALAAVLATGTAGVALVAPAIAKEKPAPAQPGLKFSPAVIKVANPARTAVIANNPAVAEPLVVQVETAATTDDDKYLAGILRYTLEQQKSQAAQQANPRAPVDHSGRSRALDTLIANPKTPVADRGGLLARRGEIAYDARQFPQALQYFSQARQLGYVDANLNLMVVKAKIDSGDVAGGTTELESIVAAAQAKGEKAPVDYYRYAIGRANKAKLTAQTVAWMNRYTAAYPLGQSWYEVLATYGLQQDATARLDNQQKIDLFRLMRASGGLPDQYFYIEYAQKAQNAGLPLEAQAVLREGLANGKIPPANTEARAMQTELTRAIAAEGNLATLETRSKAAANGALAGQTADAYLSAGNWAKAAGLYQVALTKGGVDANIINTRLGIALARAGDKPGALAAFAKVSGTPRGEIASFWANWISNPTTGAATTAIGA